MHINLIEKTIMGEAKRRKELGISPREKSIDLEIPQLDKKAIQKKVRATLYKYPIIPILFYSAALLVFVGGSIYVLIQYKVI